jgi:hypothetical protein
MAVANVTAYYDTATITDVKSFLRLHDVNLEKDSLKMLFRCPFYKTSLSLSLTVVPNKLDCLSL